MLDDNIAGHPSVLWSRPLRLTKQERDDEVLIWQSSLRGWWNWDDWVTSHASSYVRRGSTFPRSQSIEIFQTRVPGRLITQNKLQLFFFRKFIQQTEYGGLKNKCKPASIPFKFLTYFQFALFWALPPRFTYLANNYLSFPLHVHIKTALSWSGIKNGKLTIQLLLTTWLYIDTCKVLLWRVC